MSGAESRSGEADVVIVGGGPAGSTVATLLKRAKPSARIVVAEASRFPRYHIGESLLPNIGPILHKLGVVEKIDRAGFLRKTGIAIKWRHDRPAFADDFGVGINDGLAAAPVERHIPDYAWQVERHRYDQLLLDHAAEHGVEVRLETKAIGLVQEEGRVTAVRLRGPDGEEETIRCGHAVDCSGQSRVFARWLGAERQEHNLGDVAIYRYYEGYRCIPELVGGAQSSRTFISATPAGWIWFIVLSETLVSVGLVTHAGVVKGRSPEQLFEENIASVPELVAMLSAAKVAQPPAGPTAETLVIQDWSYSHAPMAGPGWYLAGDAAAFVDPILSSGVLLAQWAGLMVANAIQTEWSHPSIGGTELRAAYEELYSDAYQSFVRMARWWYEQREVGIEDWWKQAAELTASKVRGGGDLTDVKSFIDFAGGYLTDLRFQVLGLGSYGEQGWSNILEHITDGAVGDLPLKGDMHDRSWKFRRNFDKATAETYLATHVDADRWLRLPAIRFFRNGTSRLYRLPQVVEAPAKPLLSALSAVLDACDGDHTLDEVVRSAARRNPDYDEAEIRRLANLLLVDLWRLDLIVR